MTPLFAAGLLLSSTICFAAASSSLSDEALVRIKFDQKIGAQVSLNLRFRDEAGTPVTLSDYFGQRPVVLVLGYYECPMLCSLVLNGVVESLHELKASAGDQFAVVNVSIDPRETPDLAAAKKRTYVKRYGRAGTAAGWHFLTGDETAIRQLADDVGFRYAYDARTGEFAHPSGFVVLTRDGKVSRYFFGSSFSSKEVGAALREAGESKVGSPIAQFVLLCFHYSPLKGKYGELIMALVRISAAATLLALVGTISFLGWRRRSRGGLVFREPSNVRRVLDCASPLALWIRARSRRKAAEGCRTPRRSRDIQAKTDQ